MQCQSPQIEWSVIPRVSLVPTLQNAMSTCIVYTFQRGGDVYIGIMPYCSIILWGHLSLPMMYTSLAGNQYGAIIIHDNSYS